MNMQPINCVPKRLSQAILLIVGIVFFPRDVFAWGPVAHIDFSMQLLAGVMTLTPAIKALIKRYPTDFIYGSLAADSVLGKNLASSLTHCHGWSVALKLLAEAQNTGERYESFVLGYLNHLGADVVAHNHYVPNRMIAHYRSKGIGHLYWEARFDNKLLLTNSKVRDTWNRLSHMRFPEFDLFLSDRLEPTLFSHQVSSRIYHRSLGIQRNRPWQGILKRIDTRSKLPISSDEVLRWRVVSVAMAAMALNKPWSRELQEHDPTGRHALDNALEHRRMLRRRHKRRHPGMRLAKFPDAERHRPVFATTYPPAARTIDKLPSK
ncbi:MAG: zinc dependent phospholipase C family protein [Proteobacteria bacterium]|nr:zinc dependent phospholipase C family protein [Pseudomonadota bacterium]